ncbi:MAG TPA: pyroglutamyl-peptidase I [Opitutaceae bacterium]
MKTILLSGFGLWGLEAYNSSWDILHENPLALPDDWQPRLHQLPVSWKKVPDALDELLRDSDVRVVICFGMCGGRTINVERIAINLNDIDREDADGARPPGENVVPLGPPAYWTGLPAAATLAALRSARVPAAESRSAGGFLCNFTFYHLMHRLAARKPATVSGFIHVPHYETEGRLPAEMLNLAVPVIAIEAVKHAEALMQKASG